MFCICYLSFRVVFSLATINKRNISSGELGRTFIQVIYIGKFQFDSISFVYKWRQILARRAQTLLKLGYIYQYTGTTLLRRVVIKCNLLSDPYIFVFHHSNIWFAKMCVREARLYNNPERYILNFKLVRSQNTFYNQYFAEMATGDRIYMMLQVTVVYRDLSTEIILWKSQYLAFKFLYRVLYSFDVNLISEEEYPSDDEIK